jgi:hypothetical protein
MPAVRQAFRIAFATFCRFAPGNEMGRVSLADALALCELLAAIDPKRYERAALRWLQRFFDERLRRRRMADPAVPEHARAVPRPTG